MLLKRLVELRHRHGLTQEEVAEIIDVGRTTYAMYEQGHREMDYALLIRLANYYKVSLDYLFGRTDLPLHFESYTDDEIEFIMRTLHVYKEIKAKIT